MKSNLQCFDGSLAPLFASRNYNHIALLGRVGINWLLHFTVSFSILLDRSLSRRCS